MLQMKSFKSVALVFAILLLASIWFPGRAAADVIHYGDVNNDGHTDVNDAILVLRDVVGHEKIKEIYGMEGARRAKVTIGKEIDVGDAIMILRKTVELVQKFPIEKTPLLGPALATVEKAQRWVRKRGKDNEGNYKYHQRFIDIAPTYWQYGELTGIRPEVLYAQSAKETNFGLFTGNVRPYQNNWAGIKTGNPTGDETEDHQAFDSPEDGVRGHYNHINAYIFGKSGTPIGTPHPRYHVVLTTPSAGTIRYVEELGGRWAPNPAYGQSIADVYLDGILNTK